VKNSLRIGTIGYPVSKKMLFPHVDIVELKETHLSIPKTAVAKRLRSEAPASLSFSVTMPKYFVESPSPGTPLSGECNNYGGFKITAENRRLFERMNRFADALNADTLVLITPSAFTPTTANRAALEAFLKEMPVGSRTVVWQPSGPWTDTQSARFAAKLGMVLAMDPLRDNAPEGESAYFRLGPFAAMGSRVGLYDLERLLFAAAPFKTTSIVFETERALDDVKNSKRLMEELGSE
jgi:uncharacterized protein YecE (DUF72 family)